MAASRLAPRVGLVRKGNAVTAARIPDDRALRDPSGACIADERQELDNAAFAEQVAALAGVFDAAGLRPGGVLAIMLPNRVELITSMFAAWRLGAAVTPVNPALTAQEARYQIDDAAATLVVADDTAAANLGDGPYRVIGLTEVTTPVPPEEPPALNTDPAALALLIYTSGTTGRPKGVMLDHANISATAELIIGWFEMTPETRCLLVLPLFHVNGIMVSVVSQPVSGPPSNRSGPPSSRPCPPSTRCSRPSRARGPTSGACALSSAGPHRCRAS
jgi:long-chain acyl-CoA synthetase